MLIRFWTLLSLLGILTLISPHSNGASSATYVTLLSPVTVYSEASEMSSEIGRFRTGARLMVAKSDSEGWRRVVFMHRGKKRFGWVLSEDILPSLEAADGTLKQDKVLYRNGSALGVSLVTSYMQQKERQLSQSDSISVYNISALTSTSFWFSVFYDQSFSNKWALRYFVAYRSVHFKGDAVLQGVGGGASTSSETEIQQSFLGAGLSLKRYLGTRWWLGAGFEAGKNLQITVRQSGNDLPVDEEDKPFLMFFYGALGWEAPISSRLYFVPELKLGAVTSIDPMAYVGEVHFALAYRW